MKIISFLRKMVHGIAPRASKQNAKALPETVMDWALEERSSGTCPACLGNDVGHLSNHQYASTFQRWGISYDDVVQAIPEILSSPKTYQLFRCGSCGLVFTNLYSRILINCIESSPFFSERIVRPYLTIMQPSVNTAFAERIARSELLQGNQEVHWSRLLNLLKNILPEGARMAEIGSCYGAFAEMMRLVLRPDYFLACEVNVRFLNELKTRYPELNVSGELVENWSEDKFDLIFCSDVIEHVWDFPRFFRDVSNKLKTGGSFIVVTPNNESDGAFREGLQWWGYLIPHHCQLFSQHALAAVAEKTGLRLTEAKRSFEEIIVCFVKA